MKEVVLVKLGEIALKGLNRRTFEDVLKNRENSPYVNWFGRIAFDGNSNYNDGLWYEGWKREA